MSDLLSSITGGGGGSGMIMPTIIVNAANLKLKKGLTTVSASNDSLFYDAIQLTHDILDYDTATLSYDNDSTEQTIIDTGTGKSGVLTQVITPPMDTSGIATIRVTIDGDVSVFTTPLVQTLSSMVFCLGDFATWTPQGGTNSIGIGSGSNVGYGTTNPSAEQSAAMLTPVDSAMKGLPIGMPFEDSMKVTIQSSTAWSAATGSQRKAAAAWLTYIPKGVI